MADSLSIDKQEYKVTLQTSYKIIAVSSYVRYVIHLFSIQHTQYFYHTFKRNTLQKLWWPYHTIVVGMLRQERVGHVGVSV